MDAAARFQIALSNPPGSVFGKRFAADFDCCRCPLGRPTHVHKRTRSTDPEAEPFQARPLTAEQIAAVADHIGRVQGHPIYGFVVLFAAFTGLRAGELAGLNVGDLTLPQVAGSAGAVSVTRTRRAVRGGWETSSRSRPSPVGWCRLTDGWPTICVPT